MKKYVLFIHGAGEGAFEEDGLLVASLQNALGSAYDVHYPKMPEEDSATYADWKAPIDRELAALDDEVILVGHSVGGSVLVKYLSEQQLDKPISSLFLLATPYWGADEFWKWDEARLPEDVAAKLASLHESSCTIAVTTRLCRLCILRCMPQNSHKQPSVSSMGVGISLATIWLRLPRTSGEQRRGRDGDRLCQGLLKTVRFKLKGAKRCCASDCGHVVVTTAA
jgi:pimeloyl-ACP methyl ester carboxylesterase